MCTQLRRLGRYSMFAVLLVLLLVGCGRGAKPAKPSPNAVFDDAKPVTSPVLAWLPADTSMVLIKDRADRLAREVGWDEVARLQPEAHARVVAAMEEIFGHDLLDVSRLDEIGLDVTRPTGVAYLDPETVAVFLPLSDTDRFEQAVTRQAPLWNQQVEAQDVGQARVLGPPYEDVWRMVLRERTALWVLALDDARAAAAANTLATSSGPGLAGNPDFKRAMDELAYGPDLVGYVAGAMIASEELGLAGAGLAFGLDYARDGIRMRATLPVQPGGLLDRLLRTPARTPALLGTLSERPLALLAAVVDGQALVELPPVRDLGSALEMMTGLSLARDVAPLLAGEIGVAMVAGPPGEAPVIHLLAELRDAAQGQAALERALSREPVAAQVQASGPGAYRVTRPGGAVVHMGVRGGWFYASTGWTPETLPALGTGSAQALEAALGTGTLATLLLGPGQAALRASIEARLLGDWFLPAGVDMSYLVQRVAELESGYEPSAAFVSKRAELEAAVRELEALENQAQARANQGTLALLEAAGTLALRVDVDRDARRMVVHAAEIAGPGGVPALLGAAMALLAPSPPEPDELVARSQARERVSQLLEELEAIRRSETGEPAPGSLPEPPAEPVPRPGAPGLRP